MSIQWYPGHMTSARKKAAETLAVADVVVEVLDAPPAAGKQQPDDPRAAHLPAAPLPRLLNKADLADPETTKAWLAYFDAQPNVKAVAISCKKASDVAKDPASPKARAAP